MILCLPKAVAVVSFLTLIYRRPHTEKKSSANWPVECKHCTHKFLTHTHTQTHPSSIQLWPAVGAFLLALAAVSNVNTHC